MEKKQKVVLLFSGGMDSYIAAHKLRSEGYEVIGLFIDYGQRNIGVSEETRARQSRAIKGPGIQ